MKPTWLTIAAAFFFVGCGGSETPTTQKAAAPPKTTPDAVDSASETPAAPAQNVEAAAFEGDLKALKAHIAAGSDLDEHNLTSGATPLIAATTFDRRESVKLLIEGGADVNATDNQNSTALHAAAFLCRTEIVKMLLDNGADKNIRNATGAIALDSVAGPFEEAKPVYDLLESLLGPLGLKLDYERIRATRPNIAELLR